MQFDMMLKLIANRIVVSPNLIDEMNGAKLQIVSSRVVQLPCTHGTEDDWPPYLVQLLSIAVETLEGPFILKLGYPARLNELLPISVRSAIAEVTNG